MMPAPAAHTAHRVRRFSRDQNRVSGMDPPMVRAYACGMPRLRRFVIALVGLAFLASTVVQFAHAAAAGGPAAIGAAVAAVSDLDCGHGDDGSIDRCAA